MSNYNIPKSEIDRSRDNPVFADSGLTIIFDTSRVIGVKELNNDSQNSYTRIYDAFPVIIKNVSSSYLVVGSGNEIPLIIEALDGGGNWRTI